MDNITVEIGADTREFLKGLNDVGAQTEKTSQSILSSGKAAIASFAAVTAAVGYCVAEFREEEQTGIRINSILTSTGGIAGITSQAVENLAESLSKLTTFSEGEIKAGEAVLLTFTGIGKDVFPDATKATLDLAAGMGGSAADAAKILGKAMEDPTQGMKALRGAGILLTETQKKQVETMERQGNVLGAQNLILDLVKTKYGGMAEATASGTGAFLQLKNVMGELAQQIGGALAPTLVVAATRLRDIISAVREMRVIPAFFNDLIQNTSQLAGVWTKIMHGIFTANTDEIKAGWDQRAKVFTEGSHQFVDALKGAQKEKHDVEVGGERKISEDVLTENRNRAAKVLQEKRTRNAILYQADQAGERAEILGFQHASEEIIKLEQDKSKSLKTLADATNATMRSAIQAHLKEVDKLETKANADENKRKLAFQKLKISEDVKFTAAEKAALTSKIKTEEQAVREFEASELEAKIEADNLYLIEQKRFGTVYAALNQVMHSEIIQGASKAGTELAQMTQSQNDTLKAIGKAASLYNIGVKTIESAENVYAGFATIPIIGQALGIAGAAAATAYGLENAAKVMAMARGGLVTGGTPGMDSVPAMLQPGELVSPTKNFEEVIGSVAAMRASKKFDGAPGRSRPVDVNLKVTVEYKGQASRIIQIQAVQDQAMGTYRGKS